MSSFWLFYLVDGEGAARYIKTTNNKNANTPILAVSAYGSDSNEAVKNDLFAAFLAKPVQKADLLAAMRQLGFKTSTVQGRGITTKVTSNLPTTMIPASSPPLR